MGLSSWVESDGAADFRYVLQQQFKKFGKDQTDARLKEALRNVVDNELDDMANCYNTPGFVNLALCIEAEGDEGDPEYDDPGLPVFSKYLTAEQLKRASRLFKNNIPDWDTEHRSRLIELHKVIAKILKARRKRNR